MAERHYSFLEHEEMTNETKQRIYYCVHDGAYQYITVHFLACRFRHLSDVPNDSPFHESIFYLAERGIVCGEGNGRYVPDAPVTVRQWATMLCRALGDADPLNYDDDCIRQGYSDGWLEMTAITAPDSDLCRYAIYKSGFAAFGVDLYSLQLYPNEGKLSQQSEVLRAAADLACAKIPAMEQKSSHEERLRSFFMRC